MPKFQVTGKGRESGRARKKAYQANNDDHARSLAEADGMVVGEVEELSSLPTDGQRAKAAELDIQVPVGITSEELSNLISLTTWHDKKADPALKDLAASYGIPVNAYSGKKFLFARIFECLCVPGREHDLVAWFAYRVYRELVHGAPGMPITGPNDPKIQGIAVRLAAEESLIKSIRRYSGDSLIWFGRYTTPDGVVLEGASNCTTAYRSVSALVRPLAEPVSDWLPPVRDIPREEPRLASPADVPAPSLAGIPSAPARSGCRGTVGIFVLAATTLTIGVTWLIHYI